MEKKRKVNKKKIVILIAVILLVLFTLLIMYLVKQDLKQEDVLRSEINSLSEKDMTTDRYNTEIKSTGDYAVVEEIIKEYLDDYAVNLQEVLAILNDDTLANILSASNYSSDGPEFTTTKAYIEEVREKLNDKITTLSNMTNTDEIMSKVEDLGLNEYYIDLYEELMIRGVASEDLANAEAQLEEAKENINNLLDSEETVIDFLIENKDNWSVSDENIVFTDENLLNQYNELVSGLS